VNDRIRIMLESRYIEESAAPDEEVTVLWEKALACLRVASIPGVSGDPALSLVYQAALQAATAVVRAAGYRVRGSGHHHHTFAAVAALNLGDLSKAARTLDRARPMRHEAVYGWEVRMTEEDLAAVRSDTEQLFTAAHRWLVSQRPHLAASLPNP
jgi:hypothetical protein